MKLEHTPTKIGRGIFAALAAIALLQSISTSHAIVLLGVDFQNSTNNQNVPPVTQTDYEAMQGIIGTTTDTETFGDYTLSLSNQNGYFNRGGLTNSGDFTYAALYQDSVYRTNNSSGFNVVLSGAGILANTTYQLRLFSYDAFAPTGFADGDEVTMNFTALAGTIGFGSITYTLGNSGTPTADFQYSAVINFTSNGAGEIAFNVYSGTTQGAFTYNRAYLNGLQIIPEPSAASFLLGSGLVALLLRRRKLVR